MSTAHKHDKYQEFEKDLKAKYFGTADSLRNAVISLVSKDKFDAAIKELHYFRESKHDFVIFLERTERIFEHCEELILAIKSKKGFPNLEALPMAKRQEIFERIQQHFEELERAVKAIERVEKDMQVQDARSTVWVIQAFILSVIVVTIWAVVVETSKQMGTSFDVILDDIADLFYRTLGM